MILRILLVYLVLSVNAAAAFGQYYGSIADPDLPLFSDAIREKFAQREFGFSEIEVQLMNQLLEGYYTNIESLRLQRADLSVQKDQIRDRIVKADQGGNESDRQLSDELSGQLRRLGLRQVAVADQAHQLKESVQGDIRSILSEASQLIWDRILRDRRRQQTIGRNYRFVAEGVDLVSVVEQVTELSPDVDVLLAQYTQELDPLLIERNELVLRSLQRHYEGLKSETGNSADPRFAEWLKDVETSEEADRVYARIGQIIADERIKQNRLRMKLHLSVREVNRRYYEVLSSTLSDEVALAFRNEFRSQAYADYPIYFPLEADRFLVAILADEEIDQNQRNEIIRLRDADYIPKRDDLNLALADAYERWELRWEEKILGTLDPSYEDRIRRRHDRRRALQERIVQEIVQLLPNEILEIHEVPTTIKDNPDL